MWIDKNLNEYSMNLLWLYMAYQFHSHNKNFPTNNINRIVR